MEAWHQVSQKTHPCVVVSPDEMNAHLQTIIIAPMTTKSHVYPTRVALKFQGKPAWIVLDQIRTVDRKRLLKELGTLDDRHVQKIKMTLKEMLVE